MMSSILRQSLTSVICNSRYKLFVNKSIFLLFFFFFKLYIIAILLMSFALTCKTTTPFKWNTFIILANHCSWDEWICKSFVDITKLRAAKHSCILIITLQIQCFRTTHRIKLISCVNSCNFSEWLFVTSYIQSLRRIIKLRFDARRNKRRMHLLYLCSNCSFTLSCYAEL